MKYSSRYPSVTDLAQRARKRVPGFAMDYLEGGIGEEHALRRNRTDLDNILLWPRYLRDMQQVDTGCELFGKQYDLGIGIAPVGLGNMMWPGIEEILASSAQSANIPYILSTMSTTSLEKISGLAPDVAWFQLYVPADIGAMKDLITRADRAGYRVLVVTVDIPVGAKRDRELKNGLILPFRLTPRILAQILACPEWAVRTLQNGIPDFVNLKPYIKAGTIKHLSEYLSTFLLSGVTPERISMIRELWNGPLVIKGLQSVEDINQVAGLGVDGVIISNHAGRQLDAAPSSVQALQAIPARTREEITVMVDSGVRSGLDVIRTRALGAAGCFTGRSFFYGVAAMGSDGGRQVIEIFRDEITRTLKQLGCSSFMSMDSRWLHQ